MFEAVKAVLKAYLTAELLRNYGLVLSLLSLALWMTLFIAPIILFAPPTMSPNTIAGYAFTAVLVFLSYSMATWDWAWELRWLMMSGMMEYILVSGRSIFIHYVGVLPFSMLWMATSLAIVYGILAILVGPPALIVTDPLLLLLSITLLMVVLFGHAMILGGTTISAGTSGPVMEMLGWILPIATGGLTPLISMPEPLRIFAILTPYSYPAELLRYSLLGTPTVLELNKMITIGICYAFIYLSISILFFKLQLKKMLKEGPKTVGMY
ncbi:MAG: ABC transporter permease [Thermoprotei archaeon]|nr:MAG: ABC transporter permease [Thermoprotei archaeon]